MAISVGPAVTDDTLAIVQDRARAFIARHNIRVPQDMPPDAALDFYFDGALCDPWEADRARHLHRLWLRILRRAVGVNWITGRAYGHWCAPADN